jgi:hypothetical protein
MAKLDKNHEFRMYTMWVSDAVVAEANNDFAKADQFYWMAARCASRLGLTPPHHVRRGAKRDQEIMNMDAERATA